MGSKKQWDALHKFDINKFMEKKFNKENMLIKSKDVKKRITLELWYFQYMQLVQIVSKRGESINAHIRKAIDAYVKKEGR